MFTLIINGKAIKTNMELKKAFEWAHYFHKLGYTADVMSELTGEILLTLGNEIYLADAVKYVP